MSVQFAQAPEGRAAQREQTLVRGILTLITSLLVLPVVAIISLLLIRGLPAISMSFLLDFPTNGMTAGGIFPAIVGTLWLVGVSLAVSAPVGVLAAVYLNEYAPDNWLTRIIQLAIVNLAGVPSIVHALFGVGAFVLFLKMGTSILSASLTLSIMTLPVIIASTREALSAVPMAFREACWNVGATRWQTIWHVVLPNSVSGILTGVILQVSRAAGETAPIIFTGAAFYLPYLPSSVKDQCMALVLCVNAITIVIRSRLRGRRKW